MHDPDLKIITPCQKMATNVIEIALNELLNTASINGGSITEDFVKDLLTEIQNDNQNMRAVYNKHFQDCMSVIDKDITLRNFIIHNRNEHPCEHIGKNVITILEKLLTDKSIYVNGLLSAQGLKDIVKFVQDCPEPLSKMYESQYAKCQHKSKKLDHFHYFKENIED